MDHRCGYCRFQASATLSLRHCLRNHPDEEVMLLVPVNSKYQKRRYDKRIKTLDENIIDKIYINDEGKVIVPSRNDEASPMKKIMKINTPTKHVHEKTFKSIEETTSHPGEFKENIDSSTAEIINYLPAVMDELEKNGRLIEFKNFFKLVTAGNLDLNNIGVQCFFDIVKFHSLENVHAMRFRKEVMEFWTLGREIFHDKFIRFMGGFKTKGVLLNDSHLTHEDLKPDLAKVNFVVPDIRVLKRERQSANIDCNRPGIIKSNIDAYARANDAPLKAHKICLDGKKLSAGFGKKLGDVDLYGHESSKSVRQKDEELTRALESVSEVEKILSSNLADFLLPLDVIPVPVREKCLELIRKVTLIVRNLRSILVSKNLALDKWQKLAASGESTGDKKRAEQYQFIISQIKTEIFRIRCTVNDGVRCNDRLGHVLATVGEAGGEDRSCPLPFETMVDLGCRSNYVCIQAADNYSNVPSYLVKQGGQVWHELRKQAKVTGSTLFNALGLSTLKAQKDHYDHKVMHKEGEQYSEEAISAMRHGSENELNGLSAIVSKIQPIYEPSLLVYEEGCYSLKRGEEDTFMVVSPDGSLRKQTGEVTHGIEIKCPIPNKKHKTDNHYIIPNRYVPQILAEMNVLNVKTLYFVSWTAEYVTVIKARNDCVLWNALINEAERLFLVPTRPKRTNTNASEIKKAIDTYVQKNTELVGEFSSTWARPCKHDTVHLESDTMDSEDVIRGQHECDSAIIRAREATTKLVSIDSIQEILQKIKSFFRESYQVLRTPAKDVFVGLISDLDRMVLAEQSHAMITNWALTGHSLSNVEIRRVITELLVELDRAGLYVPVVSTDGQFCNLNVRDASGRPLTIHRLATDTWERSRKEKKSVQIEELMRLNYQPDIGRLDSHVRVNCTNEFVGPINVNGWCGSKYVHLYNPPKFAELVKKKQTRKTRAKETCESQRAETMEPLLSSLPIEVVRSGLADDLVESITETNQQERKTYEVATHEYEADFLPDIANCSDNHAHRDDSDSPISSTNTSTSTRTRKSRKRSPKSLRLLLKDQLSRISKQGLNAAYATHKFLTVDLPAWRDISPFRDGINLEFDDSSHNSHRTSDQSAEQDNQSKSTWIRWFSHPEYFPSIGHYVFYMLDTEHLLVNMRGALCKHGFSGFGVDNKGWVEAAMYYTSDHSTTDLPFDTSEDHNMASQIPHHDEFSPVTKPSNDENTRKQQRKDLGLNLAMVTEPILDRQDNKLARLIFSEKVRRVLRTLGWTKEADFAKVFLEWYEAEDSPGMSITTRHERRLALFKYLTNPKVVNFATFPPAGTHMGGIPVVLYEGILTNIERRITLHAVIPGNAFNVRATTTLDSENFFGEFQTLDPKGTGVPMADDVPQIIQSASYVMQKRLQSERNYYIHTTKKTRVYPVHELLEQDSEAVSCARFKPPKLTRLDTIILRNHAFDNRKQTSTTSKYVGSEVADVDEPSKGTFSIRSRFHKSDHSRVLHHVRYGLRDS